MKKYLIICILVAAVCNPVCVAKKKDKKKQEAPVEKVDTVSMDVFSYAYGVAQTNGFVNYLAQRMGVDTKYMQQFLDGFNYAKEDEQAKQLKAWTAGVEIRAQIENEIAAQVNNQIDDSLHTLVTPLFVQGFRDALAGNATIDADSAQVVANKQLTYFHEVQMEAKYGDNRIKGEQWLAENAKKDSVKTTASGLQYKVLTMGTGAVPTTTDKVKVNYEGKLIDGTVFDSSYKRKQPATFGCNQVIKGWTEALTMMPVGSRWEIYIPQELAYADRDQGKIPPFSTLIFTVELLEIVK